MKIDIKQDVKRFIVYSLGLFIMALGVAISKLSDLGVSPVNSIPCVVSEILNINMGVCTTAVFIGFILIQIIVLKKEFKKRNLLQIGCSFLFGLFVSIANALTVLIVPECSNYIMRLIYVAISMVLVAVGILLYLEADLLSLPGEGVMQAVSYKTGIQLSTSKMIFDWSVVIIATILAIVFLKGLVGVREGTVIAAFGVGICLKFISKFFKEPLRQFLVS